MMSVESVFPRIMCHGEYKNGHIVKGVFGKKISVTGLLIQLVFHVSY